MNCPECKQEMGKWRLIGHLFRAHKYTMEGATQKAKELEGKP